MKNDKEVVKVYVDNLEDIFNKFDNNDISDELANYIEQRCSRTAKNSMEINIITKEELDNEQKDKLVTAIRSHYGLENKYLGIEIKKLNNANIIEAIIIGTIIQKVSGPYMSTFKNFFTGTDIIPKYPNMAMKKCIIK